MRLSLVCCVLIATILGGRTARAEPSALLSKAISNWDQGASEFAFTQETITFGRGDKVKEIRVERFDPSLPDKRRWHLISVDGKPPTEDDRKSIEVKRNNKPRKKPLKPLAEYFDLEDARLVDEDKKNSRFEIDVRTKVARLIDVEKLSVIVTVKKQTADIVHISVSLIEPIKIVLGIAKVTGLDLDFHIAPDNDPDETNGAVKEGSTMKVKMSKFGDPMEYTWSDFKRVEAHGS